MDLPYVTRDLPGIGGRLRLTPEQFTVEELPLYEPAGAGQHLYVRLTKEGLTTRDVQLGLERLFQLPHNAVGFAGMKDKHARTTQTFSLNVGHVGGDFPEEAAARIGDALPVQVHWAKLHANKLQPGHLLGNRFTITIGQLELSPDEVMERARPILARLAADGMPNYFGPQRFGVNGDNVERGRAVIQGRLKVRDRWLRRFLASGYQSYLCNAYLARRLETGAFRTLLDGDVAKKHATGGVFDVEDAAAEQPRFTAHEISFTAPMFGPKMRPAHGDAAALEESVFAESAVTLEQLRQAKVEGTRRMGRLLAADLEVVEQGGDSLALRFSLPKGAFATTVLRELMKVDVAHLPSFDEAEEPLDADAQGV